LNLTQIVKLHELPSDSKFTPVQIGQYGGHHLPFVEQGEGNVFVDFYTVIEGSKAYAIICSMEKEKRELYNHTMNSIISTLIIE